MHLFVQPLISNTDKYIITFSIRIVLDDEQYETV